MNTTPMVTLQGSRYLNPNIAEIYEEAQRLFQGGAEVDAVIALLRKRGCFKIDSIKIIRKLYGLNSYDAKYAVHHSPAWSDRYEADTALQEALWEAAKQLAAESEKDPTGFRVVVEESERKPEE